MTDDKHLADELMAKAIYFLQVTNETLALELLSQCSKIEISHTLMDSDCGPDPILVTLYGSLELYERISRFRETNLTVRDAKVKAINKALNMAYKDGCIELYANYEIPNVGSDWRSLLIGEAPKEKVLNQGEIIKPTDVHLWQNLRFASPPEIKIAEALERVGVLFFPNCAARLGPKDKRVTRYPDFLVCKDGKWGILEVDGKTYHPPENRAQENERDRLFQAYRIFIFQHYDAQQCTKNPDKVVQEFLDLLSKS